MSNEGARFQPRRAIRFIFEYEGERLRLVTQQTVDMVVPLAAPAGADAPGYYLDARDSQERTLARVAAHGAFTRSAEVFPERHDDPITRIDVERQRGAFTVTLPEVEQADHVTVVRVVAGRTPGAGVERVQPQAVDVASFPLSAR
jgi:hypothetical protein